MALAELRAAIGSALRRLVSVPARESAATADLVIDGLVEGDSLVRDGDTVRLPAHQASAPDAKIGRASARLVEILDVPGPPALPAAAADAGCPPSAVRELERQGRIVVVDDDLAWSREAYARLMETALTLARSAPMSPAALRDATGTSRKYVMALLEDLGRRGILTRTPAGHVPGPRAPGGTG
jgi:selenocysteine-specific elongation factor